MDWHNPKSVETKIRRLTREITAIDKAFYLTNKTGDRVLYAGMLERKRDDMVRGAVLQLHTAIEDVLNSLIICRVLDVRPQERKRKAGTKRARALHKVLYGAESYGFDVKLNLAMALNLISGNERGKLSELNTLRNKCSHNWLLKLPVRRGRRPKQKKPPLLLFRGQDLHRVAILREFTGEYGQVHYRLFGRLYVGVPIKNLI